MYFKRSSAQRNNLKRAFMTLSTGLESLRSALEDGEPLQKRCEKAELPRGPTSRDNQRADKVKTLDKLLRKSRDITTPASAQNGKSYSPLIIFKICSRSARALPKQPLFGGHLPRVERKAL